MDRALRAQGFTTHGNDTVFMTDRELDTTTQFGRTYRSADSRFEAVTIGVDNTSDPDCFSVDISVREEKSSELIVVRVVEDRFLSYFKQLPDWQAGEGSCIIAERYLSPSPAA